MSERTWAGKPWRDEDNLRELYIEQDMTGPEIADEWGCCTKTVSRWLKSFGIGTNSAVEKPRESELGALRTQSHRQLADWRVSNKRRDEYIKSVGEQCELCGFDREKHRGEKNSDLHVHHIEKQTEYLNDEGRVRPEAHDFSNLIAVCAGCHRKEHTQG